MHPLSIVAFLFWAGFVVSLFGFLVDRPFHEILRKHWKLILGILIILCAWRFPREGQFFHGLEYEDSYVYTVAGRQIAAQIVPETSTATTPFSLSTCTVGSLSKCQMWEPAPEHLIGYPYVISVASKLMGYTPEIGSVLNFIASVATSILIFSFVLVETSSAFAAGAAALIFAATPAFAVYGLETSAEPALNFAITLCLWFYARFTNLNNRSPEWNSWVYWCAFTLVLLFSLVIKREGIVLAIILMIISPFVLKRLAPDRGLSWKLLKLICVSAGLCLWMGINIRLANTTMTESKLLMSYPPTIGAVGLLALGYLKSFFIYQCYLALSAIAIIGAAVCGRRRGLLLFPLALATAYLALYAIHIRGFYEMRSPSVDPWNGLRFSMSFMTCFAILGGVGVWSLWAALKTFRFFRSRSRLVATFCCIALVGALFESFLQTSSLREDSITDERLARLLPAFAALDHEAQGDGKSDYIVTFEPLVLQMYGDTGATVIDLQAATGQSLEVMNSLKDGSRWILIDDEEHRTAANEERYREQLSYLHSLPWTELQANESFRLLSLDLPR